MHYVALYPQNGDRIVTTAYVTSLHRIYTLCGGARATGRC